MGTLSCKQREPSQAILEAWQSAQAIFFRTRGLTMMHSSPSRMHRAHGRSPEHPAASVGLVAERLMVLITRRCTSLGRSAGVACLVPHAEPPFRRSRCWLKAFHFKVTASMPSPMPIAVAVTVAVTAIVAVPGHAVRCATPRSLHPARQTSHRHLRRCRTCVRAGVYFRSIQL